MRDQHHRSAGFILGLGEDFQDLCLHCDVECRGWFVGDDDAWVVRDRHGDHRALAHTAGELVREGVDPRLGVGNPDESEQFNRAAHRGHFRRLVVNPDSLSNLISDRVHRGEG